MTAAEHQPVTVRRVTDPTDPALSAFGRIQQRSYYAPESLIPPEFFPELLAPDMASSAPRQDRIAVAYSGPEVLGGTVYHLLGAAGFNSFMGVAQQSRGRGVGRALQRFTLQEVRQAGLPGMFADSVYGARQSQAEQQAERRVGTDPQQRRVVLGALGFYTVDVPYWQPVGGENGGPLTDLDLLYCPLIPTDHIPLELVLDTLQGYWQGWLGQQRAQQEVSALAQRHATLRGGSQLRLLAATQTPRYWDSAAAQS